MMDILAVYSHPSEDTYRATVRRALEGAEQVEIGDFLVTDYIVGPSESEPIPVAVRALVDAHVSASGEILPSIDD